MQPFNNKSMQHKSLLVLLTCLVTSTLFSQQIKLLESGKRVSIRGLSVVDDKTIWASGSNGSVARSTDGGASWTWMVVPGYEKRDFRDIEAFDKNTAIIIAVAEPAFILKTKDGGKTWKQVYTDSAKGVFLDAMAFTPKGRTGTVIGDPLPGTNYIYQLYTRDLGDTWEKLNFPDFAQTMQVADGEAFFASSGTNVTMIGGHPLMVTGGKASRVYQVRWDNLPIMQGKESTGANSLAAFGLHYPIPCVVVGGDFSKDTISSDNCVLFELDAVSPSPVNMRKPETPPHGYRSCVIYLEKDKLVTCGTSGIDISNDGGKNWTLISKESFHVVQKAKKGKAVFLAGSGGRIAKLEQ
jgi:hypothetical protein